MEHQLPTIRLESSVDGLGVVLVITNATGKTITVSEPHPHTSIQLTDVSGKPWPMHYGVFAATPRWRANIPSGEGCQRIVTFPRFFLDAKGVFAVRCSIPYRVGSCVGKMTVQGPVRLTLPTTEEYYSKEVIPARQRVERYENTRFVYPLPDLAEPLYGLGSQGMDADC